jgi:glycerol-3-phosphate acyltransferase PlsY
MNAPLVSLELFVAAYLCGSVPFGLLLAKMFGVRDVRQTGSGNIGATNVARSAGPLAGVLTLVLDASKGATPVWLVHHYAPGHAGLAMLAGLAALIGHCFPSWLKFKGGKGVATAAGVFAVLCPLASVGALGIFALVVGFWRYVSLASVSAAAAMPLLVYLLWAPHYAPPLSITLGSFVAAALIVFKHDKNLQRLVDGTEPKFSFRKKNDPDSQA